MALFKKNRPDASVTPEASPGGADVDGTVPNLANQGPYDADTTDYRSFDFSDFAKGGLDLGSMLIPVPHEAEVQVEMGEQGPQMIHILTPYGRLTPVAFAAPRSSDLWEESLPEIITGMTNDGLSVTQETGPWGEEIVATAHTGTMRIVGVQGDRWMLRMTTAGPTDKAEQLAELTREVISRCFIRRGDHALPAGAVLPVTIPQAMADELRKQIEQRNLQAAQQAAQEGAAQARGEQPDGTVSGE